MKTDYIPALHHYGHQGLAEFHARQVKRHEERLLFPIKRIRYRLEGNTAVLVAV